MVRIAALKLFFLQELALDRLPEMYRAGNQFQGAPLAYEFSPLSGAGTVVVA